jgi:hypothetical protein
MKIAVSGSRTIDTYGDVLTALKKSPWFPRDEGMVITGGADGVDSLAERIAESYGIETMSIEPRYDEWGPKAPLKRNVTIVERADALVAVWDGQSNGTRDTIDKALDRGLSVYIEVVE